MRCMECGKYPFCRKIDRNREGCEEGKRRGYEIEIERGEREWKK